jgi:hypothetical protein
MKEMANMFQLVLQMPTSSIADYDKMIELEEIIINGLSNLGDVDGHDAGSGEMNIFILTDDPKLAFERIKSLPCTIELLPDVKVAFREIGTDEFTIIHPPNLTHFTIA